MSNPRKFCKQMPATTRPPIVLKKRTKTNLLEKAMLALVKPQRKKEPSHSNRETILVYKKLFGKTYVLSHFVLQKTPLTFRCRHEVIYIDDATKTNQ